MKRNDRFPKKYLTKEDVGDGLTVCIADVQEQEVQSGNGRTEDKTVCLLKDEKPLIVNGSNWDTIADLYGGDDEDWSGHWITLYHDRSVSFGGKRVGGIRVKPDKPTPELAAAIGVAQIAADGDVDDCPI